MKLRSFRPSSSIKGEGNYQYQDSSDEDSSSKKEDNEDGFLPMSSDSDYIGSSDEDEDIFNLLRVAQTNGVLDNDFSEEVLSNIIKRRKVGSSRKRGSKNIKSNEEQVEEEHVDRMMNEVGCGVEVDSGYRLLMGRIEDRKKNRDKNKKKRPTLMWEIWEEENDRWMAENYTNDLDLDCQNGLVNDTAETPSDLLMPLLRYQKEWLAWALKQEESTARGGILADEMGMGKTVQAIALVLAKRELGQAISESSLLSSAPCTSQELPAVKGTLVICPVVAVIQWVSEIDRFTTKGSNKILVYHGANREKNIHKFAEYDFVITTYSTVEAEYRKNVMPPKEKCQWCGKSFYEQKLSVHQRYFCGPDAVRTAKQLKQERKKSKPGGKTSKLKKESIKGKAKTDSDSEIETGSKRGRGKGVKRKIKTDASSIDDAAGVDQDMITRKSILHSVKWNRIILDEAHYVKDRRCNTTRAIFALESSYKWALSGTPLQNRVGELYSLVRFLQMIPYSYYFCKDCDCRVLDYSPTDCPHCPHKSVRHFCWWNKYIASPIQSQGNRGTGRDAMVLLKHKILKSILLRRTKKGRAADLALPPRIVTLRKDSLDVKEEDYYTSLYNESQAQFNTYIQAGTLMNNYAHIFDLLTRLRQAVDHPYLVVYSSTALARSGNTDDSGYVEQPCGLCHDPVEDPVVASCTHVFCKSCLIDFSATVGQVSCPSCSKPLAVDFTANDKGDQKTKPTVKGFRSSSILNRIRLNDFQTSTKIDALREEIRFMVERDGSAKAIVFSQFTSFLDLIHYSLQKSGISCVQLVGSMSITARDSAITRFTEDPDCRIFLMSLKAGGVALNLTVASHVFLMDPWWNPAVEQQAQDRIHRIGQYKPIRIVRFVIENTIEERILKLQEKKELVFEGTVGGSSEALGKLTEADLKFLFVT
ncbi:DNA repair protein RAD16 [Nicotiana sylvestris]|uniref:DNA repair protein RAD16 isoform X1 n=1 Tax=Nicotiana sylvestris TaxID=4096 RepID=A0A1U7XWG1_NICSY|nr:PREDICTED: DNA repair protein RAD16 isoform X1 [Nicotiana sylvestris]XP_009795275.1 PREDICTED: DNA repair protein RAD16 isoform X1 [Nicotiana sylvestris]XP_016439103.1 PREDICTED: DNA repair protein RAD16-like [Nicotiana tabacum]